MELDPDGYTGLDVSIEGEDDVLDIQIDREETYNSLTLPVFDAIDRVVTEAMQTDVDDIRVIVLSGKGDNFSSGGDVNMFKEYMDDPEFRVTRWANWIQHGLPAWLKTFHECPIPIITKIRGYATGAGVAMATSSDIPVASTDAQLGDLHTKIGYSAPLTPAIWPPNASLNKVKELMMTGELISGEEAKEIGIVNHAVPPEEVDDKVDEIIHDLASSPQYAVRYSKMVANKWLRYADTMVGEHAFSMEAMTAQTQDFEAAVNAYLADEPRNYVTSREGNVRTGKDKD